MIIIMRIRLRVPKDASPAAPSKPAGWRGWVRSLFTPAPATAPCPPVPPAVDKRWIAHGETRFFFAGRRTVRARGAWESQYLFDVLAPGAVRPQQVRILLPETLADDWQQRHGRRLTEAERRGVARETLEALLGAGRLPESLTLTAGALDAIAA